MIIKRLVEALDLKIITGSNYLDREVKGGHVGDLLSVVMGKAKEGQVWVTIHGHINMVAVALFTQVSCIIVTEGFDIELEAIKKAKEEQIVILSTELSSYDTVKALVQLGVV